MALNDSGLNVMADALKAAATHVALHTADPGTGGTNESSAARQAATWSASASGDFSLSSALNFTGGAADGACTHVGLWSASSGGTFYGGFALTGDQAFNALGEYTVNTLTINGAAT
jgi:hypothetical protein